MLEFNKNKFQDGFEENITDKGLIEVGGVTYSMQVFAVSADGNDRTQLSSQSFLSDIDDDHYGFYFNSDILDPENKLIEIQLISEDGTIFSATTEELGLTKEKTDVKNKDEGFFKNLWRWITETAEQVGKKITEILCDLLLTAGDAFLHMISIAVGEPVTIDGIVYDEVEKINIDFFESEDTSTNPPKNLHPLKDVMTPVINTWYNVFLGIAIIAYMIMLVYIGLRILLNSTAETKASYKSIFGTWILGIFMLFLFPYVIKYTIKLNSALCRWCAENNESRKNDGVVADNIDSGNSSIDDWYKYYGDYTFPMAMLGFDASSGEEVEDFKANAIIENKFGNNIMLKIRCLAQAKGDVILVLIYYVQIGQLLALLIMYYKRVFMIAFLITIFPLVATFYPINKIGDVRLNCFGVWFKEFVINVITQAFHAVTYTIIVQVGLNAYLSDGNWLFMLLCIFFLFEGEKIIRAIFNARSSMNTIGELAAGGTMLWGMVQNAGRMISSIGKGGSKSDKNQDEAEQIAEADRNEVIQGRTGLGGSTGEAVLPTGGSGGSSGGDNTSTTVQLGRQTPMALDSGNIDKTLSNMERKGSNSKVATVAGKVVNTAANIAGTAVKYGGALVGATLAGTYTLATSGGDMKDFAKNTVAGFESGKTVGGAVGDVVRAAPGKVADVGSGLIKSTMIRYTDAYDDEFDLSEARAKMDSSADAERKAAYRTIKAYEKAARRSGISRESAEIVMIKEQLKQLNS